jgi:hypothetical protein
MSRFPEAPAFFRLLFFGPLIFGGLHDCVGALLHHL